MTHDEEIEVRRQFLEEAQEYIDAIADGLASLDHDRDDFRTKLDSVLRASHSLKGASAMMQYEILSHSAHQLEDAFKLLKSHRPAIDENIERLLLIGVDLLAEIVVRHRQGKDCDRQWYETNAAPTLNELNEYISLVTADSESDEAADDDEDTDVVALMFESEVEEYLDNLEQQLAQPQNDPELAESLKTTAEDLAAMAEILELLQFHQLCQQVIELVETLPIDRIQQLARTTLSAWRRSQALVLTGNIQIMPKQLELPESLQTPSAKSGNLTPVNDVNNIDDDIDDLNISDINNIDDINEINNIEGLDDTEEINVQAPNVQNLSDSSTSNDFSVEDLADFQDLAIAEELDVTGNTAETITENITESAIESVESINSDLENIDNEDIDNIDDFADLDQLIDRVVDLNAANLNAADIDAMDEEEIALVSDDLTNPSIANDLSDINQISDRQLPEPQPDLQVEPNITDANSFDDHIADVQEVEQAIEPEPALNSDTDENTTESVESINSDLFGAIEEPESSDLSDLGEFESIDFVSSNEEQINQPAEPTQSSQTLESETDLFAAIAPPRSSNQNNQTEQIAQKTDRSAPTNPADIPPHTDIPDTLADLQTEIPLQSLEDLQDLEEIDSGSIATEPPAKTNSAPVSIQTSQTSNRAIKVLDDAIEAPEVNQDQNEDDSDPLGGLADWIDQDLEINKDRGIISDSVDSVNSIDLINSVDSIDRTVNLTANLEPDLDRADLFAEFESATDQSSAPNKPGNNAQNTYNRESEPDLDSSFNSGSSNNLSSNNLNSNNYGQSAPNDQNAQDNQNNDDALVFAIAPDYATETQQTNFSSSSDRPSINSITDYPNSPFVLIDRPLYAEKIIQQTTGKYRLTGTVAPTFTTNTATPIAPGNNLVNNNFDDDNNDDDDDTIILDKETALAIALQQQDTLKRKQSNPFTTANQATIFTAQAIATVSPTPTEPEEPKQSSRDRPEDLDPDEDNINTALLLRQPKSTQQLAEPTNLISLDDLNSLGDLDLSNNRFSQDNDQENEEDLWGDLDQLVDAGAEVEANATNSINSANLATNDRHQSNPDRAPIPTAELADAPEPPLDTIDNLFGDALDGLADNITDNITGDITANAGVTDATGIDQSDRNFSASVADSPTATPITATEPVNKQFSDQASEQNKALDPPETIDDLFGDAFAGNNTTEDAVDNVSDRGTESLERDLEDPGEPENLDLDQQIEAPLTNQVTSTGDLDRLAAGFASDRTLADDLDLETVTPNQAALNTDITATDLTAAESLENSFAQDDLFGNLDSDPDLDLDTEPAETDLDANITASSAPNDIDSFGSSFDSNESDQSTQWQGIDAEIGDLGSIEAIEDIDPSLLDWQTEPDNLLDNLPDNAFDLATTSPSSPTTELTTNKSDQSDHSDGFDESESGTPGSAEFDRASALPSKADKAAEAENTVKPKQAEDQAKDSTTGKSSSSRTNFFAAYVNESDESNDDQQSSLAIPKQTRSRQKAEPSIVADTLLDLFEDLDASQDGENAEAILQSKLAQESKTDLVSVYLKETSIRLPIARLDEMNDLSDEIVVERNIMEAQLRRLRELYEILSQRINELDNSDTSVHVLYDKLSLISAVNPSAPPVPGETLGATNPIVDSILDPRISSPSLFDDTSNNVIANPNTNDSISDSDDANLVSNLSNPDRNSEINNYAEEFDHLEMDRFGELHTLVANIIESIVKLEEVKDDISLSLDEAEQSANAVGRSFKQLQTKITQARMRPLADIVGRFPRMLRSLSLQYGKQVEVEIEGGDLLIDRAILDALTDPLNHIVRNAFDHGLEDRQTRLEQNKPEIGKISIKAISENNTTTITIGDDGRGIDIDKIREKVRQAAIAAGMNPAQVDSVPAEKLLTVIFEPGFTTVDRVTALSGRGVGMDVVRTNLQQIGAEIKADTKVGIGTTFTITFTNTLASVQALLIEVNNMFMAMPTPIIKEIVPYESEQLVLSQPQSTQKSDQTPDNDRQTFNWIGHDEAIAMINLNDYLHFNRGLYDSHAQDKPFSKAPAMVICQIGDQLVAIAVDCCWGEQDASIRQVESDIPLPKCFSGCIISGSGQAVPLLNPKEILNWLQPEPIEIEAEETQDPDNRHDSSDLPDNETVQEQGDHLDALDPNDPNDKETEQVTAEPTQPKQALITKPNRVSVLVIDDSVNVRRYLALTLDKAGFYTEQAKDGEDALSKLRSGLSVDAIVSDIEMPRLDGYGLLANLRADSQYDRLPIVMLTSRSGDKHRMLAMNLGATEYFTKPYQEKTLVETLKKLTSATAEQ
jgi:chemotaxis protein histidine kinase CheA